MYEGDVLHQVWSDQPPLYRQFALTKHMQLRLHAAQLVMHFPSGREGEDWRLILVSFIHVYDREGCMIMKDFSLVKIRSYLSMPALVLLPSLTPSIPPLLLLTDSC